MPARCARRDEPQPDAYWSIVSDLVSLIDRTRGYQRVNAELRSDGLNEITTASPEAPMLNNCNLRLRQALHILLEARASRGRADGDVARNRGDNLSCISSLAGGEQDAR